MSYVFDTTFTYNQLCSIITMEYYFAIDMNMVSDIEKIEQTLSQKIGSLYY
jgi:hypothetical protein